MDTHNLGSILLSLNKSQADRHPSTEAAEDSYYAAHTPADRFVPRILPVVAMVSLGVIAIGLSLQ